MRAKDVFGQLIASEGEIKNATADLAHPDTTALRKQVRKLVVTAYANGKPYNVNLSTVIQNDDIDALLDLITQETARQVAKAKKRAELRGRLDELKKLQALHTRTYRQTVTDNAGNIYVDDSHAYISKYETQERIALLGEQLTEMEKER